jgi:hypothetical protein
MGVQSLEKDGFVKPMRTWIAVLCGLAWAGSGLAQEALYANIDPPSPDANLPPTAVAVYASTINHEGIKANPASITISIPRSGGALSVTVQRQQFIPRSGFSATDQSPLPGAPATQFAYTWTGSGEGYNLRLTFQFGAVAGILVGPDGRFLIGTPSTHEMNLAAYPLDDSAGNDAVAPATAKKGSVALPSMRSHAKASGPDDIDMLVLYTEEARVAAGGPAGQCIQAQDSASVLAVINQALVDTNTSFANSQVTTRLGNVTIMRIVGFPAPAGFTPAVRDDAAFNSANIQALRNSTDADVVTVVTENFTTLNACGVAFVQRPGCTLPTATPGCGVGAHSRPCKIHPAGTPTDSTGWPKSRRNQRSAKFTLPDVESDP